MRNPESGQNLLIVVLIIGVLTAVAIPIAVEFHRSAVRVSVQSVLRERADGAAQDSLAYALHVLSSTAAWETAQAGRCPAAFGEEAASPRPLSDRGGMACTIRCAPEERRMPQEAVLHLEVVPGGAESRRGPLRRQRVRVVRKTVSIGGAAPVLAAVQLARPPAGEGRLVVHWGPVFSFDTQPWTLAGPMDALRFPRKFAQGLIYGETVKRAEPGRDTDGREWFGRTGLGTPVFLDLDAYRTLAESARGVLPLARPSSRGRSGRLPAHPPGSGYFSVEPGTATLAESRAFFTNAAGTVIFIDGNAVLDSEAFDASGGALLVTGNLLLRRSRAAATLPARPVRVPRAAAREYPYEPLREKFPCAAQAGGECVLPEPAHLRGFCWVGGNLIVESPAFSATGAWTLHGALRVEGELRLEPEATLTVYFDEAAAAAIRTATPAVGVLSIEDL